MQKGTSSRFEARLLRPKEPGDGTSWAFVILPTEVSATLPRRGRTTVEGTLNGRPFQTLLEPDGRKSHWLRVDEDLLADSGAVVGELARFEIRSVAQEPEPEVPADMLGALDAAPQARAVWEATTTACLSRLFRSQEVPSGAMKRISDLSAAVEALAEKVNPAVVESW